MQDGSFDWMAFLAGFAAALLLTFLIRRRRGSDLSTRPSLPIEIPADIRPLVLKMRAEGETIAAIKLVRDRTRCDLKAAKKAVERLR